jgi:hypothetical protein
VSREACPGQAFTTPFAIEQLHRALIRCRRARIDPWLVDLAILFGSPEAIEQLSAVLLERQRQGKLGKDLARYLICHLFVRCHEQRLLPPTTLVELLTLHLDVEKFAADQIGQAPGALSRASQLYHAKPWLLDSELGEAVGVSKVTIRKWRKSGALTNGSLHGLCYET